MRMLIAAVISILTCGSIALADTPKIWVQPFTEANDQHAPDWINKTLRQSLIDELVATHAVQNVEAREKLNEVQFVINGQIQRIDGELRVSGQVLDPTGKPVGGFKATGNDRQLFAIEDSIATQVMAVVAPGAKTPAVAMAPTSQPAGIETPFAPNKFGVFEGSDLQLALRGHSTVPAYTSPTYYEPNYPSYPTYPVTYGLNGYNYNPYGYGGYGYGYGWGWPSSVIIIGNGGHHGDGGHDGHHDGGGMHFPSSNGQAIRAASGFGGSTPPPGVVNTITPGAPGTINTISGTGGVGSIGGGGARMGGGGGRR